MNDDHKPILADLLFALADDFLMLGHRNSDWTGLAPILEEDIAFSSLAQDDIAHAQAVYEYIGTLLDRDPNHLAFGRQMNEYRCAAITQVPDEFDWATAIVRQFFCSHYNTHRLRRLCQSNVTDLAQLAKRLLPEQQVHVRHVNQWVHRLGQGTLESRERTQQAMDALAPLGRALMEPVKDQDTLEKEGIYPQLDADRVEDAVRTVEQIAADAGLEVQLGAPTHEGLGARQGMHTEHFHDLLQEMTEVYRIDPAAKW